MRRILEHEMRTTTVRDAEGNETPRDEVARVNFIDHNGALHGLVFHPLGTDVSGEEEDTPRIVGEHVYEDGTTMRHYSFPTPEEAVAAYENGEVV